MSRHAVRILCVLLCAGIAIPIHPEPLIEPTKESFGITMLKSAGTSAASAGGVAVAKALAGVLYDSTCAKEVTKDLAEKYFCDLIAGFSGRKEDEWKAQVEAELKHISSKLDALDKGQERLQHDLDQQHKEMYRLFKQAAAEQIATKSEVGFETLWTDFQRQFDKVDADVNREAMIRFAKKVLSEKMEKSLGDYNTVLTKPFRGNQALLRYPFYDYKERRGFSGGSINFNHDQSVDKLVEAAEMAFMDARARQEKVHTMVMWALKALEIDCKKNPATCEPLPFSSADFKKRYDGFTQDQIKAYNEGLDWLLFTYGSPQQQPRPWFLPGSSALWLTKANFLNASLTEDGRGVWGRVISMGTGWNGTISVSCSGVSGKVKPRFSYLVHVDGPNNLRELDWWTSRAGNGTFDEVRFAQDWTVYHYYLPEARKGACTVSQSLDKGIIPWVQPGTEVMTVKRADGTDVDAGSFIAIHRAGGTYALASGSVWRGADKAHEDKSNPGGATIKNEAFRSKIETSGELAKAGLLSEGRGEMTFAKDDGGRVHKRHQLYVVNEKSFYFPEGRALKLEMNGDHNCLETCRGSESVLYDVLDYNIENGKGKKEKGKLDALVSVFFHPKTFDPRAFNDQIKFNTPNNGIVLSGSYDWTNDNQKRTLSANQTGSFKPDPNVAYKLQYLIDFDMVTEGTGWDATQWMYRAKISPWSLFVRK